MSSFKNRALQFDLDDVSPSWMHKFHNVARRYLKENDIPSKKDEGWKNTPLAQLDTETFKPSEIAPFINIAGLVDNDHDVLNIMFVDGVLHGYANKTEGLEIVRFKEADSYYQDVISQRLNSLSGKHDSFFSNLNLALCSDGIYVKVPKKHFGNTVIRLLNFSDTADYSRGHSGRLIIDMEEGAEISVVECFYSKPKTCKSFSTGVTEIFQAKSSKVDYFRVQMETGKHTHIGDVFVDLNENCSFNSIAFSGGSNLQRLNYNVDVNGENSSAEIRSMTNVKDAETSDINVSVNHLVPNCKSNQLNKSVVIGTGQSIYNGKIHIAKDAQKTIADMNSKNLLEDKMGAVFAKPVLEIYADDVKCSHGVTVSEVSDDLICYFKSRGINEEKAKEMLAYGMTKELLLGSNYQPIKDLIDLPEDIEFDV